MLDDSDELGYVAFPHDAVVDADQELASVEQLLEGRVIHLRHKLMRLGHTEKNLL